MSESIPLAKSSANRHGNAGSGRQITRNRASYSCHTCRRRKVKCDKIHPICGNCLKNGAECIYDNTTVKKNAAGVDVDADADADDEYLYRHGAKRRRHTLLDDGGDDSQSILAESEKSGFRGGSHAIEARLDKLTNMIESLSKAEGPLPVKEMSRQLQTISQDIGYKNPKSPSATSPTTPSQTKHSPRAGSPRRTADLSGDEFPIPTGNATDPVDPVGSLNLGHLSLEDGKSRYVGTTYWAYISDEINELNQLLREQNRIHDNPPSNDGDLDTDAIMIPADDAPSKKNTKYRSPHGGDQLNRTLLYTPKESPIAHERAVEPHMLEDMPTRRQSDILYKGFMSGVHAITPVLHPPTILQSYHAFWDWYEHKARLGERYSTPSFIPLLYSIWHGGSVTISIRTIKAEFPGFASRSALSGVLYEHVIEWLDRVSFPRNPTLHALISLVITRTILSREEEPLASSLFISTVLRVAQTMGLHRDPAQFGIRSSEAETRRRVWWHIIHMDGVVSMSSGLPPLVCDENYWDVRETSEVKDTLLGTPQAEQYTKLVESNLRPRDNPDDPTVCGGNSMVNVFYLSARGKYVMGRAVRRIMRIQLGTKPVTGRDMEELRSILVDLQFQLNSLINRIPLAQHPNSTRSDMHSTSPNAAPWSASEGRHGVLPGDGPNGCTEQYHTPVLVAFHKWARIVLSLYVDKAFCVAYQPFLKNAKSRIWPAARQSALRHCHGFMEKFIALATDPDFQPFQWSWPGNHQPMHATMIMLIDLYERPNNPQALRSRAFIDKIFSISGPDGGVVGGEDGITTARPLKDGGREAWDMIWRLREKAWQRAGLDPKQLWTEQAQVQAGLAQDHSSRAVKKPVDSQIAEFNRRFYDMTRAQTLPNPVISSLRHGATPRHLTALPESPSISSFYSTPPSHSASFPSNTQPPAGIVNPNMAFGHQSLDATLTLANPSPEAIVDSPTINSRGLLQQQQQQPQEYRQPSQTYPMLSVSSSSPSSTTNLSPVTSPQGVTASTTSPSAPTPPSMVDHHNNSLTFDWDQWDAVFGQQLPMADELSGLDPVAGGMDLGSMDLEIDLLDPMTGDVISTPNSSGGGGWHDFGSW